MSAVWITGLGVIGPHGVGRDALANWLHSPQSCFQPTPEPWLQQPGAQAGYCAALPAGADSSLAAFENVSTDRACAMALLAAQEAWAQAGLPDKTASTPETDRVSGIDARRAGVFWGTGMGGLHSAETSYERFFVQKQALRPMTVVRIMANSAAGQLALRYGLKGSNQTFSVACASSAMALGEALWAVRSGRLDVVLAGGSEAMLLPGVMSAWNALKVMATQKIAPDATSACRPFAVGRAGLVIGEGAACFVLERAEHAIARGAKPIAVLSGYGSACDAASLVHPEVEGQVAAMRLALEHAGMRPEDIQSINAHATGTDRGDIVEAQALREVYGSKIPPVSSSKALHGHLLGAAGAYEGAVSVLSLQHGVLPAALNLGEIDPRCEHLDIVQNTPRPAPQLSAVMSNSFAFGGSNVSLILSKATH